jgi:hypothetical protein
VTKSSSFVTASERLCYFSRLAASERLSCKGIFKGAKCKCILSLVYHCTKSSYTTPAFEYNITNLKYTDIMPAIGHHVTAFFLLVGSAFLPLLFTYYYQQQQEQQEHNKNNIEDDVAEVVKVVCKVRRRLERGGGAGENEDDNLPP